MHQERIPMFLTLMRNIPMGKLRKLAGFGSQQINNVSAIIDVAFEAKDTSSHSISRDYEFDPQTLR